MVRRKYQEKMKAYKKAILLTLLIVLGLPMLLLYGYIMVSSSFVASMTGLLQPINERDLYGEYQCKYYTIDVINKNSDRPMGTHILELLSDHTYHYKFAPICGESVIFSGTWSYVKNSNEIFLEDYYYYVSPYHHGFALSPEEQGKEVLCAYRPSWGRIKLDMYEMVEFLKVSSW